VREASACTPARFEKLLWMMLVWAVVIFGRLVWLQIFRHDELLKVAQSQQQKKITVLPRRGTIFDRSGQPLAKTLLAESIGVNPQRVHDQSRAAAQLAMWLQLDRRKVLAELTAAQRTRRGFLWIKHKVTDAEAQRVEREKREQKIDWLDVRTEQRRVYPRGPMAGHVVGSMGRSASDAEDELEHGTSGVEAALEEDLMGRPGQELVYNDVRRHPYDSVVSNVPEAGSDITLTIDPNLQFAAERELDRAMEKSGAKTGSIVVMNPYTGEVLAMANAPRFDPNRAPLPDEPRNARSNLAISTPYEPGSVFKVVTISAALETTSLTPDSPINCYNGTYKMPGRVVHDTHAHGVLSVADVLAQSSNIGAIQIGLKVGEQKMNEYVHKFGFGSKTGIGLPGESTGQVRDLKDWGKTSIASISFGHELGATAIQLAVAGSVVANGGLRVTPRVLLARKPFNGELEYIASDPPQRILKPETAILMRQMMEGVVLHGTGKEATLKGYTSAGKTGSAQIYDVKSKTYTHTYNSSFLGFAPVANPQVVVAVTLNGTSGGAQGYGGVVAAPVFREVMTAALRILDVPKDLPQGETSGKPSTISAVETPGAQPDKTLLAAQVPYSIWSGPRSVSSVTRPLVQTGTSSSVDGPGRSAGSASADGTSTESRTGSNLNQRPLFSGGIVPDFRGMTLRAVLEESAAQGLPVEIAGSGIVRAQEPPPGAKLRPNEQVKVQFGQ
jgi:cell division protein FtsI (penicillin-binding protein 3)